MFFFSSLKLQYRRTIVLLNKLKLFKETSFSKARMVMRFPAKKNPVAQKHHAISRQERWHFPLPVGLLWDFPPPPRESVRVYTDVTTKIFQIDRLPNFLSNGAPLAGFAHRLRYNPSRCSDSLICRQVQINEPKKRRIMRYSPSPISTISNSKTKETKID